MFSGLTFLHYEAQLVVVNIPPVSISPKETPQIKWIASTVFLLQNPHFLLLYVHRGSVRKHCLWTNKHLICLTLTAEASH